MAIGLIVGTPVAPTSAKESAGTLWMVEAEDRDVSWRRARKHCERAEVEGTSGFRLPTTEELEDLARRAADGDALARQVLNSLDGAAAWSRGASPSNLAWAASFEHGYLFRIHTANERGLRALCVHGPLPAEPRPADGDWLRALDTDAESALLWPCTGERSDPVIVRGSLQAFRRFLPPGPLRDTIEVDFVIDAEGRTRYIGPSAGTPDRYGVLAVQTIETFRFEPATCDGEPIPVFHHLDFGGQSETTGKDGARSERTEPDRSRAP